ncbi:MAG: leucine-rich repeat protein [Ruminococcus sp.]|nr:leucine-rich repeat protein [Ruminococcus sp.]
MKRRIISSVLAFSLIFGAAAYLPEGFAAQNAITARAAETYGDYEYTVLDNGTVGISKYTGSDTEVTIPSKIDGKSVTSIGVEAFFKCKSLKSISMPNSITSIAHHAFYGCTGLTSIDVPNSITSIDYGAFFECTSLTSITIPYSVTSIGDHAFSHCTSLTGINVDSKNANYSSLNGVLYNKDKTELIRSPEGIKSITIPDSVTSIDSTAFYYCKNLTSITIPDSVTRIGSGAFIGCESLKSITIPNSVTSIGIDAFENCTSLSSITIPDSVTSIGSDAFDGCTSLKSINIPDSVTSIGYKAFFNTLLKSVMIPKSVKSIDDEAFGYLWDSSIMGSAKLPGFKIYCYIGTAGEKYAKDNGFDYEYITSLKSAKVTLSKTSYAYTGKAKKPSVTVKLSGKTLKKGTDFTVTYKNNKSVGTATVTITGKGAYTGKITKTFKINPKATSISKLTSPKTKQLKVTYKKVSGVTGYQVTYSTSKKFTKSTTKTVGVKSTSKTIKSLKKGKTYYVKVRDYKTVNGTKYYSAYSSVKKIKVK